MEDNEEKCEDLSHKMFCDVAFYRRASFEDGIFYLASQLLDVMVKFRFKAIFSIMIQSEAILQCYLL